MNQTLIDLVQQLAKAKELAKQLENESYEYEQYYLRLSDVYYTYKQLLEASHDN